MDINNIKAIIAKYELFQKNEDKFKSRHEYYTMPIMTLLMFIFSVPTFILESNEFLLFFVGFMGSLIPSIYYLIVLKEIYDNKKKNIGIDEEVTRFLNKYEKDIIQYIHGYNLDKDYNLFFEELKLSFIGKDEKKIIELLTKLTNKIEKDHKNSEKDRMISQYDSDMGINNLLKKEKNSTYML